MQVHNNYGVPTAAQLAKAQDFWATVREDLNRREAAAKAGK